MQAKHTPGPWTLEKRGKLFFVKPNDSDREYVFANEADAALIAAAPELASALSGLFRWVAGSPYSPAGGSPHYPNTEILAALSALRKAGL